MSQIVPATVALVLLLMFSIIGLTWTTIVVAIVCAICGLGLLVGKVANTNDILDERDRLQGN
jgi:hypothetical protein